MTTIYITKPNTEPGSQDGWSVRLHVSPMLGNIGVVAQRLAKAGMKPSVRNGDIHVIANSDWRSHK